MCANAYICTHTQTHTHTHTHTHISACRQSLTCNWPLNSGINMRKCIYSYVHMALKLRYTLCVNAYVQMSWYTHTHTHTSACLQNLRCTRPLTHAHTCVNLYVHMYIHKHTNLCMPPEFDMQLALKLGYICIYTYVYMYTYTHTHTHISACRQSLIRDWP